MKKRKVKIASAYVQGISHLKNNIPCQDKVISIVRNDFSAIVLADGASSSKFSHIGAYIVTKTILEILLYDRFNIFNTDPLKLQKIIIENLLIRLSNYTKEKNIEIKELATTLLFVAIKNNKYLAGHLGDGVIGYKSRDGNIHVLTHPENGEFANSTFFITSDNSYKHLRIVKGIINDIDGFILMSDGAEESLYDKRNKVLSKVSLQLIDWLEKYSEVEVTNALNYNLENIIRKRTFDDCSIGIIKLIKK